MEDKLAALPFMLLSISIVIVFFILDFQIDRIKRKLEKGEAMKQMTNDIPYWNESLRAHDTISRQAAIDAFWELDIELRPSAIDAITCMLQELPSAQSDLNEWCTDCKEYNQEKHCCPRFNRVIRETLDEVEKQKTGKWIVDDVSTEHCSVCKHRFYISALFAVGGNDEPPCCPNCGTRMVDE